MAQQQQLKDKKAEEVYDREYFRLMDGTELEVKPLPIKKLKKATNLINEAIRGKVLTDDDGKPLLDDKGEERREVDDDELIDAFVSVVEFVMQDRDNRANCEHFLEPDNGREELEDTLDQSSMYEIVRVATGYDFLKMSRMAEDMMEKGMTL